MRCSRRRETPPLFQALSSGAADLVSLGPGEIVMRVFQLVGTADPGQFVAFWSARYKYDNEYLYDQNIGQSHSVNRVWRLFEWKNGTINIAARKRQSVETVYLPQLASLPTLRTHAEGRTYVGGLAGGAIWNIFWLHCLNRGLFPIFDQHTYRAMASIEGLTVREIPSTREDKTAIYFDQYIPFLARRFPNQAERDLDKALFTYGRFLKSGYA
ncbi:MAG: hypothetical protein ACREXU_16195 [Gammaproteobacteria bacterium]